MNTISGIIDSVEVCESLSLVRIKCDQTFFSVIIIETPQTVNYLEKGHPIKVLFKETELIISPSEKLEISIENSFHCRISAIKKGELLSRISLHFNTTELSSIITSHSLERLNLQVGMDVTALVKTNEIMLAD
jgi:molybdopterin-binding protein